MAAHPHRPVRQELLSTLEQAMSAHHSAAMEWLCRASGRALFNEIIRRASSAEAHLLRSHHGASARTGAAAPVSVADAAASGSGAVVGAQTRLARRL